MALNVKLDLDGMFAALNSGIYNESPLDGCANSYEFVEKYNIKIDGRAFDWGPNAYAHMVEPYKDDHPFQTYMAGAQTGKSARLITAIVRYMVMHWGDMFGYFFPDYTLPKAFSTQRFAPFIRSNEHLGAWLGRDTKKGKGVDAVLTRTLGQSVVYFLSVQGKSATEGLPLRGVFFDEVRRMAYHQVQLAEERYSAQRDPIDWKVSTAFYPNSDIHLYFLRGDQRWYHSACGCGGGVKLSSYGTECLMDLRNVSSKVRKHVEMKFAQAGLPYLGLINPRMVEQYKHTPAAYYCPKCGEVLVNPRDGWWEPDAPEKYPHSWQMAQILSPTYPAARVLDKIDRPTEPLNIQEIWNSLFGLPYLDPTRQPVKLEHLMACVDNSLEWPGNWSVVRRRSKLKNCSLGMDIQAGYNVVVIKELSPNGKHRTVHLEVVKGEDDDPWEACARLMVEYDVKVAVIDMLPAWNESLRFAKRFLGRVWLATYGDGDAMDMVSWGDRTSTKAQVGQEIKFRHKVRIHRTKGLRWSLDRWVERKNETPPANTLIQRLPVSATGQILLTSGLRVGNASPVAICQAVYWKHLQSVAFRDLYEDDEEKKGQGKRRLVAEHVGLDPHFAHADLYASIALARNPGRRRPR